MAKKEKTAAKKARMSSKQSDAAVTKSGKPKKGSKERFKGKGNWAGTGPHGDDLGAELAALGLRIKDITGDGNCFFRALGDQLQGEERQHMQLRQRIVSYMVQHQDDFSPFVEDDENFDSYVVRMRKDGVWAGYMEVVAASRCLGANLTIYQAGQPRWHVINHPEESAPMLHLSYHDGQHYNSVRCADDFSAGPPAPVVFRGDGTVSARPRPHQPKGNGSWDEQDELRVGTNTACTDMALVRRALEEADGDVEAAIERVIEALSAKPPPSPLSPPPPPVAEPTAVEATAVKSEAEVKPSAEPVGATEAATDQPASGETTAIEAAAVKYDASTIRPEAGEDDGVSGVPSDGGARVGRARCESEAGSEPGDRQVGEAEGAATADSPAAPSTATATAAAAAAPPPTSAGSKGVRVTGTRVAGGKVATRKAAATASTAAARAPSNNKRCPCGSNKKYKTCCGPAAAAAQRRRAASGTAADAAASSDGCEAQADGRVLVAQIGALVI